MLKDVLREARTKLRLKQEEVAEKVKVSKQTYLKWENGTTEPKASQVEMLSKVLDVTPNEICKGQLNTRYAFDEFIRRKAMTNAHLEVELLMLWELIPDHEAYIRALDENYINGNNNRKVMAGAVSVRGVLADMDREDPIGTSSNPIRNPLTSGDEFWNHHMMNNKRVTEYFKDDLEFLKATKDRIEKRKETTPLFVSMNAKEIKDYLAQNDPEQHDDIFIKGECSLEEFQDIIEVMKEKYLKHLKDHEEEIQQLSKKISKLENGQK